MLSFALAVFLLLITPGPGVLSAAGVGAAFSMNAGYKYVAGLCVGTNIVALAVVTGLSALLLANPVVRTVLLVLSAAYILYLAFRIAFAGAKISFTEAKTRPGFVSGILLNVINPKAYAVNTTFFTGFAFFPNALLSETIVKFVIINAIWIPIHILWLWAGSSLRKLDLAPQTQFRINILMALSLVGVVVLAALHSAN